jgi:homoserine dehydrogenase
MAAIGDGHCFLLRLDDGNYTRRRDYDMSDLKTQPVFLLGFGGVGRALARQIVAARELHAQRNRLRLDIVGVADSASSVAEPSGLSDVAIIGLLDRKSRGERLTPTPDYRPLAPDALPSSTIFVDTTATDATTPILLEAKANGMGAVLANKLPLAGKLEWWDAIADEKSRWETTCGAALPVISTLNTLLDSGDEVTRIEGSLSGTLGFIASQLEMGVPFGEAVRDAKAKGYTEPDPRQDLGGLDAARKALILARMLGYRLEMNNVSVESLYPASMDGLSVAEFLRDADALDAPMKRRAAELTAGGKKLRYAAEIENGKLRVGLMGADPVSKLGSIRSSDGIAIFYTKYFNDNPLAVSGRGAGQEVTASGVLGDIVSLSKMI